MQDEQTDDSQYMQEREVMDLTTSQYEDIAYKINQVNSDKWLLELQGIIEYKLYKIKKGK